MLGQIDTTSNIHLFYTHENRRDNISKAWSASQKLSSDFVTKSFSFKQNLGHAVTLILVEVIIKFSIPPIRKPKLTYYSYIVTYKHKRKEDTLPAAAALAPSTSIHPSSLQSTQRHGEEENEEDGRQQQSRRRRRLARAQGGRCPRRPARARRGAGRRRRRNGGRPWRGGGGGDGVPREGEAGDQREAVRGADIPVRRVQPGVLRGGARLPRPPRRAAAGGGRGGGGGGGGRVVVVVAAAGGGVRGGLVQRAPAAHHQRHGRRQVHGRHTLQQRLLRAGGRRGGGGDERPRAGAPLSARIPPQRHAGDLRRLLRRARGRDGGGGPPPAAAAADLAVVVGGGGRGEEDSGVATKRRRQQCRRRRQIGDARGCSSQGCSRDHPMTTRQRMVQVVEEAMIEPVLKFFHFLFVFLCPNSVWW